jgi:hypothetical protein
MDDSRSVQSYAYPEPPASARFLLPPSTASSPRFQCGVCAGSEFTIETWRRAEDIQEIWAACGTQASLAPHQRVFFNSSACPEIQTCVRCAAAEQRDRGDKHAALVGQLVFASRDLAENQFCTAREHGRFLLKCAECRKVQTDDVRKWDHQLWCRTGRVLRLLESLMQLSAAQEALMGSKTGGAGIRLPDADAGVLSFPSAAGAKGGVR